MTWFNNLETRWKMLLGFSVMILFMLIIGISGFYGSMTIQSSLQNVFESKLPSLNYLVQADRDLQQLLVAERSLIFSPPGSKEFKKLLDDYNENLGQADVRWGKYKKLASDPSELALFGEYETARDNWKKISGQVVERCMAGNDEARKSAIELSLHQAQIAFENMRDQLDKLQEINLELAGVADNEARRAYKNVEMIILGSLILGVLLGVFFTWVTTRSIVRPLSKAAFVMSKLSVGSLKHRVGYKSRDEVGQLSEAVDSYVDKMSNLVSVINHIAKGDLNIDAPISSDEDEIGPVVQQMTVNLRNMVQNINEASSRLSAGSSEVANSSQALSQGATEQAASLEEISSALTQVGAQTKSNAENAQQADQVSKSSRDSAEKGNKQMEDMITAMKEINDSSKEIAKIIKAIDEIAFQTNLLALNAAVEAARAGKHGKGFAVVAQEVRGLAGRSAKAANETTELIENSMKKVSRGAEIVDDTALSLKEIVDGVSKVTDIVGEIAAASNEQSKGISEINTGLKQIEQVTQSNTSNAEQTASAAVELSGLAQNLKEMLAGFKLKDSGRKTEAPVQPAPKPTQRRRVIESEEKGWGSPLAEGSVLRPDQVISLDESEFGKY